MNAVITELWPYLVLILVGFLPNEIWRVLGLVLARGLNEDSEIVVWSRAVATAIIAGVIAKLILFAPAFARRAANVDLKLQELQAYLQIIAFAELSGFELRRADIDGFLEALEIL